MSTGNPISEDSESVRRACVLVRTALSCSGISPRSVAVKHCRPDQSSQMTPDSSGSRNVWLGPPSLPFADYGVTVAIETEADLLRTMS
jgi:hypothetical protein